MSSMEAEIIQSFREYSQRPHPDFLREMVTLARKFNLSSDELLNKWESYKWARRHSMTVDAKYMYCMLSNLTGFDALLQAERAETEEAVEEELALFGEVTVTGGYNPADYSALDDSFNDFMDPTAMAEILPQEKAPSTPTRFSSSSSSSTGGFVSTPAQRLHKASHEMQTPMSDVVSGNEKEPIFSSTLHSSPSSRHVRHAGGLTALSSNLSAPSGGVSPSTSEKFRSRSDRGRPVLTLEPLNPEAIFSSISSSASSSLLAEIDAEANAEASTNEGGNNVPETSPVRVSIIYDTETNEEVNDERSLSSPPVTKKFRLFRWAPAERAEALYSRVENAIAGILRSKAFLESHRNFLLSQGAEEAEVDDLDDLEVDLGIPTQATPQEVYLAGRIADEDPSSLRTTAGSIVLHGVRETPGTVRLRLGHRALLGYSLFPGQAVVVRGINSSGHTFVANAIFTEAQEEKSDPEALQGAEEVISTQTSTSTNTVVVAQGPYSTSEDLSMGALNDMIESLAPSPPHVLILQGPFLPASHPLIAKNELLTPHAMLFAQIIRDVLLRLPKTTIVLVPSTQDIHHPFVFPQPPFTSPSGPLGPDLLSASRLVLAPNPCVLDIAGTKFAIAGEDPLLALSSLEITQNKHLPIPPSTSTATNDNDAQDGIAKDEAGDVIRPGQKRMVYSATHLLSQRCLYPIFPPPDAVPLHLGTTPSTAGSIDLPKCHIDVLVVPSKLRHFAAVVPPPGSFSSLSSQHAELYVAEQGNTLVVNPEQVTKGGAAGFYAQITIHPGTGTPANRSSVTIFRV